MTGILSNRLASALVAGAAVVLSGCASLNQLSNDVSTYSQWPEGRKPGTYAFERLPSQQARPEQQQILENAARQAIESAGFTPAPNGQVPDVTIQVGARVSAQERSPHDDPFWWHGGFYGSPFHGHPFHGGRPGWYGGYPGGAFWGPPYMRLDSQRYDREVALLVRDRKTGQPLYEARAVNSGVSPGVGGLLPAMFAAAMVDFPQGGLNPRRVVIPVTR